MSIARRAGAALHVAVVHVPGAFQDDYTSEDLESAARRRETAYLDALRPRLAARFKGPLHVHHLEGIVQETLAAEIVERQADLVVMNAHGWGYISRAMMGSVSDYLVRHASVPLLLMHNEGRIAPLESDATFGRLLVCLDGSPLAETILEPATALGGLFEAEYRLLRVVAAPYNMAPPTGEAPLMVDDQRAQTAVASYYLDAVARRFDSRSLRIATQVASNSNVAAEIVGTADASGADLIAISTHGRGGLARLLLGSVADKVIRSAKQPVLVYHPAAS